VRALSSAICNAAFQGNLDVCAFIRENGATKILRTKDSFGRTPMWLACKGGHLEVIKWLFQVGAADDICIRDNDDRTPLFAAGSRSHLSVATWLVLQGAANGSDGHVDGASLLRDVHLYKRPSLRAALQGVVNAHAAFVSVILAEVRFGERRSGQEGRPSPAVSGAADIAPDIGSGHASTLYLLRGHEETLLLRVFEFTGAVLGRPLRNAREALSFPLVYFSAVLWT
jgi:hypothetical protein